MKNQELEDTQKVGMVIGRFLPPHLGHQHLFDFAKNFADKIYIIVESVANESIPSTLRHRWVQKMAPDCEVLHLQTHHPQQPEETPEFWNIWKKTLKDLLPQKPDYVFASEGYGEPLAALLGARFVPVDPSRSIHSISASAILSNPLQHWEFLPLCVRPHFVQRVCVFGPESTGKTTLAKALAEHYNTRWVPEYARTLIEAQNGSLKQEDMILIAKGQSASEAAITQHANRLLFSDTDALATSLWSQWLFQDCDPELSDLASKQQYHLTLLLQTDLPWVEDPVRYLPHKREECYHACRDALQLHQRNFVEISGNWEERFQKACNSIDQLLGETVPLDP